ncbi:MAG: altronate dehydratase [Lachnospiraceae bacterium]|nr:altronate dehydratase [Lachnospiraceae bacterium]
MDVFRITPDDNVAVALTDLKAGEKITIADTGDIQLKTDISKGHKFALKDIRAGEDIIKYGNSIGTAVCDILMGEWVHTHNVKTGLDYITDYTYEPVCMSADGLSDKKVTFNGFIRENGEVGIRNEIWIIPTTACVNDIVKRLARLAEAYKERFMTNIDSVVAFTHPYGCSQTGEDKEATERILADLATHPNTAGVLIVGLGCENSPVENIKAKMTDYDEARVRFMVCQDEADEIERGEELLKELIDYASEDVREEVSADRLTVGLKCGGSDGLSGITANPLLGHVSDRLIDLGACCILTEVPEMFGAEKLLMNRCRDEKLFEKLVDMINNFKRYFKDNGQNIYENPSPGNKKGGITTLEDKSLGCTQKSGTSQVVGILDYGERIKEHGLNLLYAPGNDPVACTALAAAHAQIILFTTGRGTPFAAPVPTMKISSNNELADRKSNWIDFNAGTLVNGKSITELTDELFEKIIDCANGEKVCAEVAGYHDMAVFKRGVTL